MERKILFKAKRLCDSVWVKGDLLHKGNKTYIYNPHINERGFWVENEEVDPSTVCQFTGLKDSKGVDIFEGDILAFSNKYENVRYSIEWLDYRYILVRQDRTKTINVQKSRIEKELCVIYNKFDRKEGEK